jgi:hypothetical protein
MKEEKKPLALFKFPEIPFSWKAHFPGNPSPIHH